METQSKDLKGLLKLGDEYQLKVGEVCVEMAYAENGKKIEECMLNILRQKVKRI